MRTLLIALAFCTTAAPVLAQEPAGCDKFKWPLDKERATLIEKLLLMMGFFGRSDLARKLATDLGIDLRGVQGTGPGGRIVERDVKAAADGGSSATSTRSTTCTSQG